MRLLLDTQAFIWWLGDDRKLGAKSRRAIADRSNDVYVSAASAWEIALERRAGKLAAPGDIAGWIVECGFEPLPIEVGHAVCAAELPDHHRDPFERMLVAQAQIEDLTLVAHDGEVGRYAVPVLDAAT